MRSMVRCSLLPALTLLVVFAVAGEARANGRVALLPLASGQGAPEDVLRLEGALRGAIEAITGRRLESPASTRELIESARALGVDCRASDLECLLKLALLVEIETLLVPSVSLGRDAFKLDLVLIDSASRSVKRAVQHTISPHSETFGKDVEGVAVELLAPERYVGSLAVLANVSGAEVKIDDAVVGKTPLEAVPEVKVGQHLVVVSKGGASPYAALVEVRYGTTTNVDVTLQGVEGGLAGADGGSMMFLSGLTLASVGGGLAVLAGVGAMGADLFLYTDQGAYAEREAVKNTGVVLLTTSAAGMAVAVVGGALLGLTLAE